MNRFLLGLVLAVAPLHAGLITVSSITSSVSTFAGRFPDPTLTCSGATFCTSSSFTNNFLGRSDGTAKASTFVTLPPGAGGEILTAMATYIATCSRTVACNSVGGTADISMTLTLDGPTGAIGLVEIQSHLNGAFFGSGSATVIGLIPSNVIAPSLSFGSIYQFVYGQPFTLALHAQGGCSECDSIGFPLTNFAEFRLPWRVYDLQGNLVDTLTSFSIPEPATSWMVGPSLLLIAWRLRRKQRRN